MVSAITTFVAAGVLTACGSDDNRASAAAVSGVSAGTVPCGGKNALTAEGSTAQENAIALFNHVWGQSCPGKNVSYNPTGSGAGREQFIAGHVDFAGSDSPLTSDQIGPAAKRCNGNPAWDLPLVFGPIALVYNLPGVQTLVVNSDVLAKIFSGVITKWSDPVLAALNPGVALPDTRITPIYRTDSSGTTDNLQKYLTADAPQSWTKGVGTEFQGGCRRRCAEVERRGPGGAGHAGRHRIRREGLSRPGPPAIRPDRHRQRRGAAQRATRRATPSTSPTSWPAATISCWT